MLNTMGFSHTLPKSSNLLTGLFEIERALGDTVLREFDLPLSSFDGCSPREGELAIPSTVMPRLAITASSELCIFICIVFNCSSKALTSALTSSIVTLFVQLTSGEF